MSFASEASKLLTNKYFLYFMVFLASTNVLGYLVTNKLNAVAFFVLVSFLTYQFSKNMAVVLLVGLVATNFMISSKMMREGLRNSSDSSGALGTVDSRDPEIAAALPAVENAKNNEEAKQNLVSSQIPSASGKTKENVQATVNAALSDVNNTDLNKNVETNAPEGFSSTNSKKKSVSENFGPRLDYAATIEQSYQNLDSMLGSDSIKQLTNDTQKLMKQQQNLFNTMNQMVPVLEGAQNMLKQFDVKGITDSLKGIGGLGSAPTIAAK